MRRMEMDSGIMVQFADLPPFLVAKLTAADMGPDFWLQPRDKWGCVSPLQALCALYGSAGGKVGGKHSSALDEKRRKVVCSILGNETFDLLGAKQKCNHRFITSSAQD